MVRMPSRRICAIELPTGPTDFYSLHDEFLSQPTSTHTHILRGDEFNGGLCAGNSSYATFKVGDKHEAESVGFNTTSGEFRQQQIVGESSYGDLPPAPTGTQQILEIRTEWVYRDHFLDPAGTFPNEELPNNLQYRWGMGWDFIRNDAVQTSLHAFMVDVDNSISQTQMNVITGSVALGNVFRQIIVAQRTTSAGMVVTDTMANLRLQVDIRSYADRVEMRHFVSPDEGHTWFDCGTTTESFGVGVTQMRLHDVWLGNGWDQSKSVNPTHFEGTRNWDCFSYIWNPKPTGFVFAHAGYS